MAQVVISLLVGSKVAVETWMVEEVSDPSHSFLGFIDCPRIRRVSQQIDRSLCGFGFTASLTWNV
jgi:hypothetical protein